MVEQIVAEQTMTKVAMTKSDMGNVIINQTIPNYQVISLIGKGAQGEVYRVKKEGEEGFFACKVIPQKSVWEREVFFLKEIIHPAFPEYYESRWHGNCGSIIMEYVEGQNLERFVKRRKLSSERILHIAVEVAEALVYLQTQNPPIIFRDIKPENIRIGSDGRVRLIDCGVACLARRGKTNLAKMNHREMPPAEMDQGEKATRAGTPGYAAPEQLYKGGEVGTYSDVYAFGKLLYYMLGAEGSKQRITKKFPVRCFNKKNFRDRRLNLRLCRIAKGCVQEDIKRRLPDMAIVLHKLCTGEQVLQQVRYEKNICLHNFD